MQTLSSHPSLFQSLDSSPSHTPFILPSPSSSLFVFILLETIAQLFQSLSFLLLFAFLSPSIFRSLSISFLAEAQLLVFLPHRSSSPTTLSEREMQPSQQAEGTNSQKPSDDEFTAELCGHPRSQDKFQACLWLHVISVALRSVYDMHTDFREMSLLQGCLCFYL